MNDVQIIIDRQLGFYTRFNYDNVLKRLVVHSEESFYGLQNASLAADFDQDPPIFACRFSEAPGYEHILALANEDGKVAIQNTTTARTASLLESFQCHNNAVFDLAWMPQYMQFVTVSGDHTACLWDAGGARPAKLQTFASHTRSVKSAVFRPRAPGVFATGARDGHVLVWDARAAAGHAAPALALRADNCLPRCHAAPAPASAGKRARAAPRAVSVTGLAFQDDLTLLSCGECDGNIKAWDLRKHYSAHTREPLPKHSIPYCGSSTRNGYTNLVVDAARVRLYASCMDNVIYCFNVATYSALPERRYVGHENGTFYIKTGLSPDGAYLVSGSSDKHAYVWNVQSSQPVVRLAGHRAEVTCAAWGPRAAPALVTCSDDARHCIWRLGPELPAPGAELRGRAEPVPRADCAAPPHWGALERTPRAPARPSSTTPGSRGARAPPAERRTRKCLAELMGEGPPAKRLRPELPPGAGDESAAPSAEKRRRRTEECSSPCKRKRLDPGPGTSDLNYVAPKTDSCFVTPTKDYETKNGKTPSPRSPRAAPPAGPPRTPSPRARSLRFSPPTRDLPNFALRGEAPHLRLMSPAKARGGPDWLTRLQRARRAQGPQAPQSPKSTLPARRNSTTEKTPKSTGKSRTLLKYFSVANKQK